MCLRHQPSGDDERNAYVAPGMSWRALSLLDYRADLRPSYQLLLKHESALGAIKTRIISLQSSTAIVSPPGAVPFVDMMRLHQIVMILCPCRGRGVIAWRAEFENGREYYALYGD